MRSVFINSLPKSGTNLVARCLDLLSYNQRLHIGNKIIDPTCRTNNFLYNLPFFLNSGYLVGIDMPTIKNKKVVQKRISCLKDYEYITAHIGESLDFFDYLLSKDIPTCIVVRDPRAVISSSVNYILRLKTHPLHSRLRSLPSKERYLCVLHGDPKYNYQSIEDRYRSIRIWKDSSKVLTIRFEDLIGPAGGGDSSRMHDSISSIIQHIDADLSKLNYVKDNLFGFRRTFNKGQVGSWKTEIPSEVQSVIKNELSDLIQDLGYND